MDTNMIGMILFVTALLLLAIVRCALAGPKPIALEEPPTTPVMAWFTLDWREKHIILSIAGKDGLLTWAMHEDTFDYDLMANKAAIDLIQLATTVGEMQRWEVLVSTTGRAHNAVWDNRGTHPARLMQAALVEALRG